MTDAMGISRNNGDRDWADEGKRSDQTPRLLKRIRRSGKQSLFDGDLGICVPQTGENKTIRKRLLIVASQVVQYSSPVFRELAQDP
jgi:hypothetical protein